MEGPCPLTDIELTTQKFSRNHLKKFLLSNEYDVEESLDWFWYFSLIVSIWFDTSLWYFFRDLAKTFILHPLWEEFNRGPKPNIVHEIRKKIPVEFPEKFHGIQEKNIWRLEDFSTVVKASGNPGKRSSEKKPFSWVAKRLLVSCQEWFLPQVKFSEVEERGGSKGMETTSVRKRRLQISELQKFWSEEESWEFFSDI